jgi:tetraacyldisaccharide 4'-kinase
MIHSVHKFLHRYLNSLWYDTPGILNLLLLPISGLYQIIIFFRKHYYKRRYSLNTQTKLPVIVVGNITVGGTGKTPFVIWLADFLIQHGYKPGIISRGYGGKSAIYPLQVQKDAKVSIVGDEAVLLARRTSCPVIIAPNRIEALQYIEKNTSCNIVISDDGLQHYKLKRQIEVVIVDGARMFGNEYCLPAGPLREPLSRLKSVDFIVINGDDAQQFTDTNVYQMELLQNEFYNISSPELKVSYEDFLGQPVHAVAGIGHPERFFQALIQKGLSVEAHEFPDHYIYQEKDLHFHHDKECRIIMTEKDAVKCESFADYRYWCAKIDAALSSPFEESLLEKLRE